MIRKQKNQKNKTDANLRVVTDPSFHRTTSIVMLDPEPHIRNQSSIIFGDRTFNLQITKHREKPSSTHPTWTKIKKIIFLWCGTRKKPCKENERKNREQKTQKGLKPKKGVIWKIHSYLDFSERDKETLLEFGIQAENARSTLKVAVGGCKSIHGWHKKQCNSEKRRLRETERSHKKKRVYMEPREITAMWEVLDKILLWFWCMYDCICLSSYLIFDWIGMNKNG